MQAYKTGKIGSVDRTIRAIVGAALIVIALLWVSNLVAQVILWVLGGGVLPSTRRHRSQCVSLLGLGLPSFAGSRCQREFGGDGDHHVRE